MKNKNDFEYRYVAPTATERREIENIKNSYMPKEETQTKLMLIRKLDSKVRNIPTIVSLILGVIGILMFGLGLTFILEWKIFVWGVIIGVLGVIPMAISYPIYLKTKKCLKNKYSEEIIKLSDELLNK